MASHGTEDTRHDGLRFSRSFDSDPLRVLAYRLDPAKITLACPRSSDRVWDSEEAPGPQEKSKWES